jgi:hypothetical protein
MAYIAKSGGSGGRLGQEGSRVPHLVYRVIQLHAPQDITLPRPSTNEPAGCGRRVGRGLTVLCGCSQLKQRVGEAATAWL